MQIARPGSLTTVFDAKVYADTASGTLSVMLDPLTWGRDVSVIHEITGGSTGGYVSAEDCKDAAGSNPVAHTTGDNIKSTNQSASYQAVLRDVSEFVKLTLHVNSTNGGTHSVRIQSLG
jgi:hypothetical protein